MVQKTSVTRLLSFHCCSATPTTLHGQGSIAIASCRDRDSLIVSLGCCSPCREGCPGKGTSREIGGYFDTWQACEKRAPSRTSPPPARGRGTLTVVFGHAIPDRRRCTTSLTQPPRCQVSTGFGRFTRQRVGCDVADPSRRNRKGSDIIQSPRARSVRRTHDDDNQGEIFFGDIAFTDEM